MHDNYNDIRSRINEQPKWFDENGCPRYDAFTPDQCPDIYANTVILLEIACQNCGEKFHVQMSRGIFDQPIDHPKHLHYGDPPAHGCIGDTMNCDDLRVLEVWARPNFDWERLARLEVDMELPEIFRSAGDEEA